MIATACNRGRGPATAISKWRQWSQDRSAGLAMAAARIAGSLLQFVAQIGISQLGGPAAIALVQSLVSWSMLLGEVLTQGTPARAMRRISVLWSRRDRVMVRNRLIADCRLIMRPAVLLIIVAFGALAIDTFTGISLIKVPPLSVAVVVIGAIGFALQRLFAEAAKSMQRPIATVLIEALAPATTALLLLLAFSSRNTEQWWPYALALLPLTVPGALMVRLVRNQLRTPQRPPSPKRDTEDAGGNERRERLHLWGVSLVGLATLQLPFLVMPAFAAPSEIGVYTIAFKLMALATTALMALAALFGPLFSRAAERGDAERTHFILQRSQIACSVIFFPAAVVMLAAHSWIASWFDVPAGALLTYLLIVTAGQSVNAMTGLPGLLLTMTGAARVEFKIAVGCLLSTLLCTPAAGEHGGVTGLAWLFSTALIVKNILSLAFAQHQLRSIKP